ncbi:MAG: hypothetical protein KME27_08725 [Lyngbya sp. HA4199-MV5]|jgi:hypothetical protein|nr:hypothetical protein [Lyngbya sp. HA4199-MV5]
MMTPLSLLERAKQGNAEAIAGLMNDVLRPQDVWVKAALDADCLQVMLKASADLNQATCIAFLRRGLLNLQPAAIAQVRAYAWRTGDAFPVWITTFSLEPSSEGHAHSIVSLPLADLDSPVDGNASPSAAMDHPSSPAPSQTAIASTIPKRRFELFKMGFVLVLVTMVYFVVAGV